MKVREINIKEICEIIDVRYMGENNVINGLNYADCNSEYNSILTYCLNEKYLEKALKSENTRAIILNKKLFNNLNIKEYNNISFLFSEDTISKFYFLHNYLFEKTNFYCVHNFQNIQGKNCIIHNSVSLEEGVIIGNNVRINSNVTIFRGTIIEDNVIVESNTTIGVSGYEIKNISSRLSHIAHAGGVLVKKNSRIGANTVIAKNIFEGMTIIGEEVQIDSMVHISHRTVIGNKSMLAAGVVLAGGVVIGDNCYIGLGAKISNNVKVGNNARINIGSIVVENVKDNEEVAGFYAMPNKSWLRKIIFDKKQFLK